METDIGCVADHTDDLEPAVAAGRRQPENGWVIDVLGNQNSPSNHGFVRPQLTSHRLVDDGDVGRSGALRIRPHAPSNERDSHRRKVAGTDPLENRYLVSCHVPSGNFDHRPLARPGWYPAEGGERDRFDL